MPFTVGLLDSESWEKVLEVYSQTVNLAVALVDPEGRLIGRCHNPKTVWSLARAARPDWSPGCLFCLDGEVRCTAAADAQRTRSLALASDTGGFVHVASPLYLGDRYLGTLLAGQVFDQYPEHLHLERVAKEFGLSPQVIWDLARQQVPISPVNLLTYGHLLETLGNAFVRERYGTILKSHLADANQELRTLNLHLKEANSALDGKVTQLADASAEKDILLNEVHHRVTNNLTVIASLLRMQVEACQDEQVAKAVQASQFRVESMALIHAQLYTSEDWSAVNFADYAAELGGNLFRSYGVDEARIALQVKIGRFNLGVDKAIPAGLILNELISNALKHAFPDNRSGTILVHGNLNEGRIELSVQDDGVGTRESKEQRKRPSLGLKIVDILCHQLKGTLARPQTANEISPGSLFRLSFPL